MKQAKEYIGYIAAIIMFCVWLFTVFYYGKRIEFAEKKYADHEAELKAIHETEMQQAIWRAKTETTLELIIKYKLK